MLMMYMDTWNGHIFSLGEDEISGSDPGQSCVEAVHEG